jgi:hypothetical protein
MAKNSESKPGLTAKGRDGSVWKFSNKWPPAKGEADADFSRMLREAIQTSGVSQYHLSKAAKVPQGTISVFLHGGDLRVGTFSRLAHVMGMDLRPNPAKAPKKQKA